jgi:predicted metalloprotease
LLAARPYRVFRMTVHPLRREIRTEELDAEETAFSGSTPYGIDRETEHLRDKEIRGEGLRVFGRGR